MKRLISSEAIMERGPTSRRRWLRAAAGGLLLPWAGLPDARAQSRVVKIVVPYSAGGAQDLLARAVVVEFGQALGANAIVENRPGAGGTIGTGLVARSAPDGNTLVMSAASHTIAASLYSRLPYDPVRDFAGAAYMGLASYVLVISSELPARSVAELVALIKANPGKYNYASAGNGSATHLAMAYFAGLAGLDMVHIPLKSTGEAVAEVQSGRAHAVVAANNTVLPFVNDARVRLLGTTGVRRSRFLPALPTVAEGGLPGYQFDSWFGLLAPAGTPAAELARINDAMQRAMQTPAIVERFSTQGVEPGKMPPDAFNQLLKADAEKMAKVVKLSGAKID